MRVDVQIAPERRSNGTGVRFIDSGWSKPPGQTSFRRDIRWIGTGCNHPAPQRVTPEVTKFISKGESQYEEVDR